MADVERDVEMFGWILGHTHRRLHAPVHQSHTKVRITYLIAIIHANLRVSMVDVRTDGGV
jgi:hypothetical protein